MDEPQPGITSEVTSTPKEDFDTYIGEKGYGGSYESGASALFNSHDLLLTRGSRAYLELNIGDLNAIKARDEANAVTGDVTHDTTGVDYDAFFRGNVHTVWRLAQQREIVLADGSTKLVAPVLVKWTDLPTNITDAEKMRGMTSDEARAAVKKGRRFEFVYDTSGRLVARRDYNDAYRRSLSPDQKPDHIVAYEYEESDGKVTRHRIERDADGALQRTRDAGNYSPLETDPELYIQQQELFGGTKIK